MKLRERERVEGNVCGRDSKRNPCSGTRSPLSVSNRSSAVNSFYLSGSCFRASFRLLCKRYRRCPKQTPVLLRASAGEESGRVLVLCRRRRKKKVRISSTSPGACGPKPASPLVPPRTQFDNIGNSNGNNMNLLGNYTNISSLLNQSTGYGVPVSSGGLSAASLGLQQRGGVGSAVEMLSSAELDPLSFTSASSLAQRQSFQNPSRNQLALDRLQNEHREGMQKFRRQFSLPHNQQQMLRGGLGNMGPIVPVKLEPQMDPSDKTGPSQNLQTLCSSSAIKLEPQQLHSVRSLGPVKLERQHSDTALVLQQQQHHQLLQMSRPPSQAAAAAQMNMFVGVLCQAA
ncbi:hypothetical protein BHM03_00041659 [Ensete ventricosum]|nr:hypothetical protein BHM03_00041659 [Ensete ventricosum]